MKTGSSPSLFSISLIFLLLFSYSITVISGGASRVVFLEKSKSLGRITHLPLSSAAHNDQVTVRGKRGFLQPQRYRRSYEVLRELLFRENRKEQEKRGTYFPIDLEDYENTEFAHILLKPKLNSNLKRNEHFVEKKVEKRLDDEKKSSHAFMGKSLAELAFPEGSLKEESAEMQQLAEKKGEIKIIQDIIRAAAVPSNPSTLHALHHKSDTWKSQPWRELGRGTVPSYSSLTAVGSSLMQLDALSSAGKKIEVNSQVGESLKSDVSLMKPTVKRMKKGAERRWGKRQGELAPTQLLPDLYLALRLHHNPVLHGFSSPPWSFGNQVSFSKHSCNTTTGFMQHFSYNLEGNVNKMKEDNVKMKTGSNFSGSSAVTSNHHLFTHSTSTPTDVNNRKDYYIGNNELFTDNGNSNSHTSTQRTTQTHQIASKGTKKRDIFGKSRGRYFPAGIVVDPIPPLPTSIAKEQKENLDRYPRSSSSSASDYYYDDYLNNRNFVGKWQKNKNLLRKRKNNNNKKGRNSSEKIIMKRVTCVTPIYNLTQRKITGSEMEVWLLPGVVFRFRKSRPVLEKVKSSRSSSSASARETFTEQSNSFHLQQPSSRTTRNCSPSTETRKQVGTSSSSSSLPKSGTIEMTLWSSSNNISSSYDDGEQRNKSDVENANDGLIVCCNCSCKCQAKQALCSQFLNNLPEKVTLNLINRNINSTTYASNKSIKTCTIICTATRTVFNTRKNQLASSFEFGNDVVAGNSKTISTFDNFFENKGAVEVAPAAFVSSGPITTTSGSKDSRVMSITKNGNQAFLRTTNFKKLKILEKVNELNQRNNLFKKLNHQKWENGVVHEKEMTSTLPLHLPINKPTQNATGRVANVEIIKRELATEKGNEPLILSLASFIHHFHSDEIQSDHDIDLRLMNQNIRSEQQQSHRGISSISERFSQLKQNSELNSIVRKISNNLRSFQLEETDSHQISVGGRDERQEGEVHNWEERGMPKHPYNNRERSMERERNEEQNPLSMSIPLISSTTTTGKLSSQRRDMEKPKGTISNRRRKSSFTTLQPYYYNGKETAQGDEIFQRKKKLSPSPPLPNLLDNRNSYQHKKGMSFAPTTTTTRPKYRKMEVLNQKKMLMGSFARSATETRPQLLQLQEKRKKRSDFATSYFMRILRGENGSGMLTTMKRRKRDILCDDGSAHAIHSNVTFLADDKCSNDFSGRRSNSTILESNPPRKLIPLIRNSYRSDLNFTLRGDEQRVAEVEELNSSHRQSLPYSYEKSAADDRNGQVKMMRMIKPIKNVDDNDDADYIRERRFHARSDPTSITDTGIHALFSSFSAGESRSDHGKRKEKAVDEKRKILVVGSDYYNSVENEWMNDARNGWWNQDTLLQSNDEDERPPAKNSQSSFVVKAVSKSKNDERLLPERKQFYPELHENGVSFERDTNFTVVTLPPQIVTASLKFNDSSSQSVVVNEEKDVERKRTSEVLLSTEAAVASASLTNYDFDTSPSSLEITETGIISPSSFSLEKDTKTSYGQPTTEAYFTDFEDGKMEATNGLREEEGAVTLAVTRFPSTTAEASLIIDEQSKPFHGKPATLPFLPSTLHHSTSSQDNEASAATATTLHQTDSSSNIIITTTISPELTKQESDNPASFHTPTITATEPHQDNTESPQQQSVSTVNTPFTTLPPPSPTTSPTEQSRQDVTEINQPQETTFTSTTTANLEEKTMSQTIIILTTESTLASSVTTAISSSIATNANDGEVITISTTTTTAIPLAVSITSEPTTPFQQISTTTTSTNQEDIKETPEPSPPTITQPDCDHAKGMVYSDESKKCVCKNGLIFDENLARCINLVGSSCLDTNTDKGVSSRDCPLNSVCTLGAMSDKKEGDGICECIPGYIPASDKSTCLAGWQGNCSAGSSTVISKKDQCHPDFNCVPSSSEGEMMGGGKCVCKENRTISLPHSLEANISHEAMIIWTSKHKMVCLLDYGTHCDPENDECNDFRFLQCSKQTGNCECADPDNQLYDEAARECVARAGAPCSLSLPNDNDNEKAGKAVLKSLACIGNSTCVRIGNETNSQFPGTCKCLDGYEQHWQGYCLMNGTRSLSSSHSNVTIAALYIVGLILIRKSITFY